MLTKQQQTAILGKLSTGRTLALAADLEALDRTPGGPELELACERVAAQLAGASRVELKTYPSGAEHRIHGWTRERPPHTEEAELWLIGPDGGETLLCRRTDNPACSMGALRSTSPEGEVFEVVDVGFGTRPTDYRSHRMAGKLALASGHQVQAAMLEALAQRQAEGLLCGPGTEGADPAHVVPNRLGDPSLFSPHRPLGFNLSAHQFNLLGNLLAAGGEVQVRVRVRTALDTGVLPTLGALLEGGEERDQRVLLLAQIGSGCSPLGAACLVEIVRVLCGLVVDGTLAPMRRTLQLLLVPDAYGAVAWLDEHREIWRRIKAVVQLDVPSAEAASRIEVQSPPPVCPGFLSDLLDDHLVWASTVQGSYRGDLPIQVVGVPYLGGPLLQPWVDRAVGLPAAAVHCSGRPAPLRSGPAPHGPLHRLIAALASAAVDLCNLEHESDLPRLLASSQLKAVSRLSARAERLREQIRDELNQDSPPSAAARHLLWLSEAALREGLRREVCVLRSCGEFFDGPGQRALDLAEASGRLDRVSESLSQALLLRVSATQGPRARLVPRRRRLSALERRAGSLVVHRRREGPVPYASLLRDVQGSDRTWLAHNAGLLSAQPVGDRLLQWVDNEHTLLEIYDQLCLDYPQADLKLLWRYLELLEAAGHVELKEVPTVFRPGEDED